MPNALTNERKRYTIIINNTKRFITIYSGGAGYETGS